MAIQGIRKATWSRKAVVTAVAMAAALCGSVQAQETFKVGIVSFLSGQAADSFGILCGVGGYSNTAT